MADERIILEIDADTGNVVKAFKKLAGQADKSGKKVGKEFGDGFSKSTSRALAGVKSKLLALGAVAGGIFATRAAVGAAAEFEQIQTRLETLTGSAKSASLVFRELKEFSAQTPFQLSDIANASSKLISFGFSAGTVRDKIAEIGEVASGSGADLGELALIYGQIGAAGKLTGERLLQLQERAIPIGSAIAKSMGVAESSVRDLVKAGKVTDAEFQKAFNSMTIEGGIFAGSLEKQSKTLSGVFSTLADNAKIFSAELGESFKPAILASANSLIKVFQELGDKVRSNAPVISENLKKIADTLLVTPAKFWLNFLAGDGAKNLQQTNTEIANLQKQLSLLNKDFEVQKNSTFSKFFNIDKETQLSILDTEEKLRKLKSLRDELIAAQPGGANEKEDAETKAKLEADAAKRQEALKQAGILKAQEDSLIALGNIGLTKQAIIEEQLAQELALIQGAEDTKAILGTEADQRRIEALNNANKQILALQKGTKTAEKAIDKTAKNINKSMNQALGNGVANGIQKVTQALVAGENVFKAFGKAVLGLVADMAIQMGKIFVATGVAQLALFATPGASILAGAALIAAGTVAKSIFGGSDSNSPGGVGGGGVASGGFVAGGTNDAPAVDQVEEREEPNTEVVVNIQGDVLDSEESGTRLVSIINDAFEKDGVVIKGAAFV